MYEDFFGFKANPFKLAPSPQFFFQSKVHRRAFVTLYHGILQEQGILVLLGHAGTGKTTLIQTLANDLEKLGTYRFIHLTYAPSFKEIIRVVASEITKKEEFKGGSQAIKGLKDFLLEERGRVKYVLVFDEAQNLDFQALEELRMLSNLELPQEKLLPVILVGQPKLEKNLASPDLSQLKQRISTYARLAPIQEDEIPTYLEYRMKSAGYAGSVESVFEKDAVRDISYYSSGIPRLINSLCHEALTYGYAMGERLIKAEYIIEAAENLELAADESDGKSGSPALNVITLKEVVGGAEPDKSATSGAEINSSAFVFMNILDGRLSKVEAEISKIKDSLSELQKKNEPSPAQIESFSTPPPERREPTSQQNKKTPPEPLREEKSPEFSANLGSSATADDAGEPSPRSSNIIKIVYFALIVVFAIAGFLLYKKSGVDIATLKPAAKKEAENEDKSLAAVSASPLPDTATPPPTSPPVSEPPPTPAPSPVAAAASEVKASPALEPVSTKAAPAPAGSLAFFKPLIPGINIRNGPGIEYPVLRFARANDRYRKIAEVEGGAWIKIRTQDGEEGWIASKFLTQEGN
ncbi:MAG: AAA family ATPase [Deltaproteobacteria bacterium]